MLCAKYCIDERWLWWDWKGPSSVSAFVGAVRGLMIEGVASAEFLYEGLSVVVGNGKWIDQIVGGSQVQ